MNVMKKILLFSLILSLSMTMIVGCGMEKKDPSQMHVAMITDSGDITDQSFNQQVYEACKSFCEKYNIDFTYKKPETVTDADKVAVIDLAVAEGYNTIVCMSYNFAKTLSVVTKKYPDIKFISADLEAKDILEKAVGKKYYDSPESYDLKDYVNTDNLYIANYWTNISGFLAGYAAVKSGYRHLGFLGGQAFPGVIMYGNGYLQGIEAAAQELRIVDQVTVDYAYAGQFNASAEITAVMDTWYSSGTEIVFACGGPIYNSVAESAIKYGGKVIGVDTDQSAVIDKYQKGLTFTSAMKRLDVTINMALDSIRTGKWDQLRGKIETIGLVSGTDPEQNPVGLPMETTQWNDGFSKADYITLVKKLYDGGFTLNNSIEEFEDVSFQLKKRRGSIL